MLARILVTIGGLLVVALFAALIAPLFIDWTDFRKDFEREASRIMGKPVVVHGSVDARLIPFPTVTLKDVRVGSADGGVPLIQVAQFSMSAELAPFLSGEALIFDMRLEQPRARIRLQPDGTLDWARGPRAAIPAKTVMLENVEIADGEIEFVDEQTGRTRRISDLSADLSARTLAGPWKIEGRAVLDGEAGSFSFSSNEVNEEGALSLRARLTPDKRPFGVELEGDLKVVDFRPVYGGRFTLTENRPAEEAKTGGGLRINGEFQLTNESIRVPEYHFEVGPPDDPYIVTGEATLDTGKDQRFLLIADGQQIDVSRIGNSGRDGKTGRDPAISLRQRVEAMMAIAADIPIPQVPGRASLKLPAIVIGDTTVRDVRLDVKPDGAGWVVDNAVALLPGRTQLEAKGRLNLKGQRTFRGDIVIASNQPSGLANWLAGSVDPAIRKLKTAGFAATVNLTDTLQQFESLEVAAGPATLKGRIERQSFADQQPSLSLQLKGNRIDLEALQALAGLVAGDASTGTLLQHAIAADLSADAFSAFGEEARDVQAVLTIKNGQLQAERVAIGALSGAQLAFSGRMSGGFEKPVVSAKMKLAANELTPFLEMIGRHAVAHPALERLIKAGPYYSDAAFDVTLTAGSKDGNAPVTFGVIGTANGSKIAASYQAPDIAQALAGKGMLLEATLENGQTPVLIGQAGLDPLPFDADDNGILAVKLQSTDGSKANGALTFTTEETSLAAKGEFDLSREHYLEGQGKLTLQTEDFEPYLLLQGIALPQMGSGLPVTLTADIAADPERIAISAAEGKVDQNGFAGELSIDRKVPGKAEGELALDTLDLEWLGEGVLGQVRDASIGGLSMAPVAQPAWTGLDVALNVKAKRFWPGVYGAVTDFAGKLEWKGDELALSEATGDWLGGKLEGRLQLGNANGSGFLRSRIDLKGGDLAAAGWARGSGPAATGKFDLAVAMEASGATPETMAHSVSGSGTATFNGVTLNGINTAALPQLMAAADALKTEISPDAIRKAAENVLFTGQSVVGAVKVPFSIAGGTVRVQNVAAGDGNAAFSAEASFDLPAGRMSGTIDLTFRPGEDALAGAEPRVQFGYAGLLAAPGVTVDVTDLSNFLSLRAFERERRRVETLQANVLEKQRLRREVALYKARAVERETERLRAIAEERRRQAAAAEAARMKAEAEARAAAERRAAEELRLRLRQLPPRHEGQRQMPANPPQRGDELPPSGGSATGQNSGPTGQGLNFDMLPDITVQ
ncbi:AsmA family protein [Sinorhizobium numidicum]|uniref:AsmA family protein n=1 Tax=Sinorhizobium numidicum TaxID=680248 RepID=A0ABY8CYL2_9HYPH|nr:AsmA-like C-terminal region-containing protein [Sinorhizobium numidicum]WEX76301.1 AsmA family protein [Sinorhizobium numidicum]WEX82962.1 AsmA family protein [Sinorhizobium numidicum]